MFIPSVIPVAASLILTAAGDQVPTYNVQPSCQAAAQANSAQDRLQTCLQSEQNAREELTKQWSQFPIADRAMCSQTAQVGGSPTYTELITCLEMARDTRNPPNRNQATAPAPSTSGMATGDVPMGHRQPRRSDVEGMK